MAPQRTTGSVPWPTTPPRPEDKASFAEAAPRPFWVDRLPHRDPESELVGPTEADLCIVGGGFTGLWAALQARVDDPDRDIVLLEGETIGFGASGRNGGFVSRSLTHGLENGLSRFGDEIELLERLGRENLAGFLADIERYGIACDLELTGHLTPSIGAYQDGMVEEEPALLERFGYDYEVFPDAATMQAEVASPLYRCGVWTKDGALVDPAKLVVGLFDAARREGVRVHEKTMVTGLAKDGDRVAVQTQRGVVRAKSVLLGTSAYPPLLAKVKHYVAPVYDYALMTEPLNREQLDSIGWKHRQGLGEGSNAFHYYRLTDDDRILWGGFEAVYRHGGPVRPEYDDDAETFGILAQNFFTAFPQLEGLRFSHRWGGAIDTCSRFSVFFGTALDGKVAYATGYTGLGVGATRFGARVALDLLDGRRTDATASRYVRSKPLPFPPEPIRNAVIQLTRKERLRADRREGRRGPWLALLDRIGLGFDS